MHAAQRTGAKQARNQHPCGAHRRLYARSRSVRCLAGPAVKDRTPEQAQQEAPQSHLVTGGRLGSIGEGRCLVRRKAALPLASNKQIVLVRHGQTTWNIEGRIQGSSNESQLTPQGKQQVRTAEYRPGLGSIQ